eukprot:6776331-Prymnesium_polylepis.1
MCTGPQTDLRRSAAAVEELALKETRKESLSGFARGPTVANDTEILYFALLMFLDAPTATEEQKAWTAAVLEHKR